MSFYAPITCIPQEVAHLGRSSIRSRPIHPSIQTRYLSDGSSSLEHTLRDCRSPASMPAIDLMPISRKRSRYFDTQNCSTLPPTVARDCRRKMAWMKARAQHTRDRLMCQFSDEKKSNQQTDSTTYSKGLTPIGMGPRRQRSTFVKDEELQCMLEDRIGTPHASELQYDDNMGGHFDVEELALAGEINGLDAEENQKEEVEPSDHAKFL